MKRKFVIPSSTDFIKYHAPISPIGEEGEQAFLTLFTTDSDEFPRAQLEDLLERNPAYVNLLKGVNGREVFLKVLAHPASYFEPAINFLLEKNKELVSIFDDKDGKETFMAIAKKGMPKTMLALLELKPQLAQLFKGWVIITELSKMLSNKDKDSFDFFELLLKLNSDFIYEQTSKGSGWSLLKCAFLEWPSEGLPIVDLILSATPQKLLEQIKCGDVGNVFYQVWKNSDILHFRDDAEDNLLQIIAKHGHYNLMKDILKIDGYYPYINAENSRGDNLINFTIKHGNIELFEELMSDKNIKNSILAQNDYILLIEKAARANKQDMAIYILKMAFAESQAKADISGIKDLLQTNIKLFKAGKLSEFDINYKDIKDNRLIDIVLELYDTAPESVAELMRELKIAGSEDPQNLTLKEQMEVYKMGDGSSLFDIVAEY